MIEKKRATLTSVHQILGELGISPSRGLSQNFLIDPNITAKIVQAAKIQPGDHVIEIGPGLGALTEELIAAGARVTAIEKDLRLTSVLSSLDATVLFEDARHVDWPSLLAPNTKIVANLPYHITSELLEILLPHASDFTLMVQKEFAERMTAEKIDRALTALLHATSDVSEVFTISPRCFFPQPKVTSSILRIKRHRAISPSMLPMLKKLYQNKRKMVRKTITDTQCRALSICPTSRIEALSLDQIYALTSS